MAGENKKLNILRKKINLIDNSLINLFSVRFNVVKKVGKFKKANNRPLCDKKRQQQVIKIRIKQGKTKGLNPLFVKRLYNLIFNEALRLEKEI